MGETKFPVPATNPVTGNAGQNIFPNGQYNRPQTGGYGDDEGFGGQDTDSSKIHLLGGSGGLPGSMTSTGISKKYHPVNQYI